MTKQTLDLELEESSDSDSLHKNAYNWNFKQDDWFLDVVLSDKESFYKIVTLKDYLSCNINDIFFTLYQQVKEKRTELEEKSTSFSNKKKFLAANTGNDKIQISLDDEYALKEIIDQYKIYEFISWMHISKNVKIHKYCILQKQKLLTKLYPLINLSIRKVIGAKVIDPYLPEFEEAVNNAWVSIIKYLTKIDTSKVMFSIIVAISHRSACFYSTLRMREKYKTILISDLNIQCDAKSEKNDNEELLVDKINSDESGIGYENMIDMLDDISLEDQTELEEILTEIDKNKGNSVFNEKIISYSYSILSGKIKKLCLAKIYAEFFIDLINSKISEAIITKYAPMLVEIMNIITLDESNKNSVEYNNTLYKLLRDWIKEKIHDKIANYTRQYDSLTPKQQLEIIKREKHILEYLKQNKLNMIIELLEFKNCCIA